MNLIRYWGPISRMPLDLLSTMRKDQQNWYGANPTWSIELGVHKADPDYYEKLGPTYIVVCDQQLRHRASMRMLPMSGPNLIIDHFLDLVPDHLNLRDSDFECSKFCVKLELDVSDAEEAAKRLMRECHSFKIDKKAQKVAGVFSKELIEKTAFFDWDTTQREGNLYDSRYLIEELPTSSNVIEFA